MGNEQGLAGFLGSLQNEFGKQDSFALREIGNKAIRKAALENNRQLAQVALVAYCLHKLSSKQHIVRHGKWASVRKSILVNLRKAVKALEKGDEKGFGRALEDAVVKIRAFDKSLGNYVQGLYEKARVKYASEAYALGLGLGQAAALTGADKKNLLNYIGVTKVHDRESVTYGIRERLGKLKEKLGGS